MSRVSFVLPESTTITFPDAMEKDWEKLSQKNIEKMLADAYRKSPLKNYATINNALLAFTQRIAGKKIRAALSILITLIKNLESNWNSAQSFFQIDDYSFAKALYGELNYACNYLFTETHYADCEKISHGIVRLCNLLRSPVFATQLKHCALFGNVLQKMFDTLSPFIYVCRATKLIIRPRSLHDFDDLNASQEKRESFVDVKEIAEENKEIILPNALNPSELAEKLKHWLFDENPTSQELVNQALITQIFISSFESRKEKVTPSPGLSATPSHSSWSSFFKNSLPNLSLHNLSFPLRPVPPAQDSCSVFRTLEISPDVEYFQPILIESKSKDDFKKAVLDFFDFSELKREDIATTQYVFAANLANCFLFESTVRMKIHWILWCTKANNLSVTKQECAISEKQLRGAIQQFLLSLKQQNAVASAIPAAAESVPEPTRVIQPEVQTVQTGGCSVLAALDRGSQDECDMAVNFDRFMQPLSENHNETLTVARSPVKEKLSEEYYDKKADLMMWLSNSPWKRIVSIGSDNQITSENICSCFKNNTTVQTDESYLRSKPKHR